MMKKTTTWVAVGGTAAALLAPVAALAVRPASDPLSGATGLVVAHARQDVPAESTGPSEPRTGRTDPQVVPPGSPTSPETAADAPGSANSPASPLTALTAQSPPSAQSPASPRTAMSPVSPRSPESPDSPGSPESPESAD
ncbi:hypothetical protein [Desertihabitans aurantiacus]|uniref:hypothetical protein n=1 Tax=Desertihabitans aurantiacus TaxID=2282477 RepID=UPI001300BE8D|nr:hypothetical protein [Desertihabitans aurantiacus]